MPRNIEAKLEDMQCGLRPGRSTTDKIYTPQETFEKSLEQAKDTCFVDIEKTYGQVPCKKLWGVLR